MSTGSSAEMENEAVREVSQLYGRKFITEPNLAPEELMNRYKAMQEGKFSYDQLVIAAGSTAPLVAARTLVELVQESMRASMQVLDIGAGTGRIAAELAKHGFKNIDGVEPSDSMLSTAREKNVYRNLYQFFITEAETTLPRGLYDAVVTSGTFVDSHLPVEALYEFLRVVKSGGLIVIVTRHKYLQTMFSLKDRLEPLMTSLEKEGRWKMFSRRIFPNYQRGDDGIVWIFKVL